MFHNLLFGIEVQTYRTSLRLVVSITIIPRKRAAQSRRNYITAANCIRPALNDSQQFEALRSSLPSRRC